MAILVMNLDARIAGRLQQIEELDASGQCPTQRPGQYLTPPKGSQRSEYWYLLQVEPR